MNSAYISKIVSLFGKPMEVNDTCDYQKIGISNTHFGSIIKLEAYDALDS